MQFVCTLGPADGVSREQFVARIKEGGIHPEGWDLVRRRVITQYFFKIGEVPGLIVFLDAESEEEARRIIEGLAFFSSGLVAYELDSVSPIASF